MDTGYPVGDEVSRWYDPLERAAQALAGFAVAPLQTNIDFLRRVVASEQFVEGTHDTGHVERLLNP